MSVDFTAVMDHGISLDNLIALPGLLDHCGDGMAAAVEYFNVKENRKSDLSPGWEFDHSAFTTPEHEWMHESWVHLIGPGGFTIALGKTLLQLQHWTRWGGFLLDGEVQSWLRAATLDVMKAVGGKTAVYLPDSGDPISNASDALFEGKAMEEMLAWLRDHYGPPPASLSQLDDLVRNDSGYNWSVYYLETLNVA